MTAVVPETLGGNDWKDLITASAEAVMANIDELSRLDAAVGDGDHGVNVTTALRHTLTELSHLEDPNPQDVLAVTGDSFFEEMGGAAGALFGSFFLAIAKSFGGYVRVDVQQIADGLSAGTDMVSRRGKANVGDKTMVDALDPAAEAAVAASAAGVSLGEALEQIARASRRGAASTTEMIASVGRARYAQESARGVQDPGATTVALMFEAWSGEYPNLDGGRV